MSMVTKHPSIPLSCNICLRHNLDKDLYCWVAQFEDAQPAYKAHNGNPFKLIANMWEVPPRYKPIINPHMIDGMPPPLVTGFIPKPQLHVPTTPSSSSKQAARYNAGKAELSYILSAPSAMTGLAEVFAFGATKYSRNNWQKGFPKEQLVDSLLRHLLAHQNGEVVDEESKLNHLDHVLWNALALADEYNGKRADKNVRTPK